MTPLMVFGLERQFHSFLLDRKTETDYSFWRYLFGLLSFTGGLSSWIAGINGRKHCVIHLFLIVVSLVLRRRVFLVFGSLGVFGYLSNEAYTYFKDSVAFPFVLRFIGIVIIALAMSLRSTKQHCSRDSPPGFHTISGRQGECNASASLSHGVLPLCCS